MLRVPRAVLRTFSLLIIVGNFLSAAAPDTLGPVLDRTFAGCSQGDIIPDTEVII